MWATLLAGNAWQGEFHNRRKDGTFFWEQASISPVFNDQGVLQHFVAVKEDITERKQANEKISELNRDFVSFLENSSDFIYFKDKNSRFRFCSQTLADITGHASWRDMIGKHDLEVFPKDTAQIYYEEEFPIFQEGKVLLNKIDPYFDASGKPGWVSTNKWPLLDREGKVEGLFGISRDITERKLADAELLRSNSELEQFSYSISHDMRQPLRMISSYLQLLERSLAERIDSAQREYFDFAIDGAKRLDSMMLGLLDYSRVGRKGEPPTWIESRAVLDEALLYLQPTVAEAQAEVRIEGGWPRIRVSPNEMLRLLQNLIANALKFRVAERRPEICVRSEIVGNAWRLHVADNGVGIAPEQIGRLFQVFQRLHSRATYEGTGIGLALCRKIAEHHGGRIWVESAGEGLGTNFYVEIPLTNEVETDEVETVEA
jgi:PAS domain S-box-containing protein